MKVKTQYACQNCGQTSPKWLGRCPACLSWNTLVEENLAGSSATQSKEGSWSAVRDEFRRGGEQRVEKLTSPGGNTAESERLKARLSTGMVELDRVLGGGLLPDSFTLLGGDPGIGKSTLLLQMARGLTEHPGIKVLYVSGEESMEQIRDRARRLGVPTDREIYLASETQLESVFQILKDSGPNVLLVDSLQTFSSSHLEGAPGSVGQVREVTARLMTLAKSAGIAVWLVGHVTKDGAIAGPKVVEHMVDTVLYFEGESGQAYRLLRAVKNRFGKSQELGVFEMGPDGLAEVKNPSALFLSERKEAVNGVAVAASLEGTRPILVELQALVASSPLSLPRRTSVGMDSQRISLLAAILERHLSLSLADRDLYFNVAGGFRLSETATDLGALAAIWSSAHSRSIPGNVVWFGEVGLTGEVRRVSFAEVRVEEAKKLGFETAIVPAGAMDRCSKIKGIRLFPLSHVRELPKLIDSL